MEQLLEIWLLLAVVRVVLVQEESGQRLVGCSLKLFNIEVQLLDIEMLFRIGLHYHP